jgi:glycosyltransferase domain-containing protein
MISIIIPTMNRSEYLVRQLEYYDRVKCPHTIYIGDSSVGYHAEKVQLSIAKLKNQVEVNYFECQELNDRQTMKYLIENTKEKYCAYIGDDDFLVPNSLSKCAEFLENNADYRTAQGCGILFSLEQSGAYGDLKSVGTYWKRKEAEDDNPSRRLVGFSSNYWVPLFSLHRSKEFYEDFENNEIIPDRSFGELMPNHLTIMRGRSKFLNCLYLVRQVHDARYILPQSFNWLTGPKWQPSFQIFHDTLRDALVEKEGISQEIASRVVKEAFEKYLRNVFPKKQLERSKSPLASIKEVAKQIPGLKKMYHQARSAIPVLGSEMSLQGLLKPSSPYHADFMPIYRTITTPLD